MKIGKGFAKDRSIKAEEVEEVGLDFAKERKALAKIQQAISEYFGIKCKVIFPELLERRMYDMRNNFYEFSCLVEILGDQK